MNRQFPWIDGLKKERQFHLDKAREYRTGQRVGCVNPAYWARYHRGEAMKLARIINKFEAAHGAK